MHWLHMYSETSESWNRKPLNILMKIEFPRKTFAYLPRNYIAPLENILCEDGFRDAVLEVLKVLGYSGKKKTTFFPVVWMGRPTHTFSMRVGFSSVTL